MSDTALVHSNGELLSAEYTALIECEEGMRECRDGMKRDFRHYGELFGRIRDEGLYVARDPTLTWDAYCQKEWGIRKSRANEIIAASQSVEILADLPAKISTGGRREAKRLASRAGVDEDPAAPNGKYRVLYADPPWKYGDQLTENYGATKYHYPTMTIEELCAMPVAEIAEDDAVLFLWVTSPLLEECFPVIEAWGFEYKTSFVWDKVKHNMGHYNSVRHEFLLVCTRGSCTPDVSKLYDSVQSIERSKKHSEKPEEFRQIIDTLYPHGNRIELFARKTTEKWEVYGNQL